MIFRVEPLLGFDCRATEDTVEPLLLEDVDLKKDSGTPPKIELNMAGAAALEVVEYVAETCDKGECILELRSGDRPYLRLYQNCSGCCSSGNTRPFFAALCLSFDSLPIAPLWWPAAQDANQ